MRTLILILALALPALASADVAPIPDGCGDTSSYTCSVSALEQPGTECRTCDIGDVGGSDICNEAYAGTDFAYECTTDLAGVEVEIWCDGPVSSSGCAIEDGPSRPLVPVLMLLSLIAGIVVARMRNGVARR